ncbi:MAG: HNH endonuclease [Clostridia bacterium]|nr:HNH endonuclease [Clostridia bacterium]
MNNIEKYVLGVVLIVLTLIAFAVCFFVIRSFFEKVKKSSCVLSALETINSKTKYKKVESNYLYSYPCVSRAEFNRFDLDKYFLEIIGGNEKEFLKIIKAIESNKKEKAKYKRLLSKIDFSKSEEISRSVKIPHCFYRQIEKIYYRKMLLKEPITEIEIICRKEYTTPARRVHTWADATYAYKDLVRFYEEALRIKEEREVRSRQIEYERSLMTSSLRYEILRRDNFRCQICGSSVQDGVKLHIDHIIPVSKGGHTVPNNLRVLCDRCNFGKSDKLE